MDKIVDHLFVFKGNGLIEDFPGNYSDYRAYEDSQEQKKSSSNEEKKIKKEWKEKSTKKTLSFDQQKEFKKLERDIQKIEAQKKETQNLFTTESLNPKEIEEYSIKLASLNQQLNQKTERWFELSSIQE
jgi:ATP-binding cassette subfamily F protein uup